MINRQATALVLLPFLLAGCAMPAEHPQAMSKSIDAATGFAAAEGKSCYVFRAGYKCGGPLAGAQQLASWVDKIEVVEGRLVRWGSRCGGEGLPVPAAERATARLSHDAMTLTLDGKAYRQSADPVKEAETNP